MIKLIRNLSLDVALGATVMMAFVADFMEVVVSNRFYILLFLFTWLIYTVDHLMDARAIPHPAHTERHGFFQKYFKILSASTLMVFLVFFLSIPLSVNKNLLLAAMGIAVLIALYFLSLYWARKYQYRYVFKELFVAIVYVFGVALVPVYLRKELNWQILYCLILIGLTAFSNLLLITTREMRQDIRDSNPSVVRWFGPGGVKLGLQLISFLALLGSVLFCFTVSQYEGIILVSMNLILVALIYQPHYFNENEWYRFIADGVFLIPAFPILYRLILGEG